MPSRAQWFCRPSFRHEYLRILIPCAHAFEMLAHEFSPSHVYERSHPTTSTNVRNSPAFRRFRSFRQVTPHDGHPVEQIRWSLTGDCFLVATGEHCAKLYVRRLVSFLTSAFVFQNQYTSKPFLESFSFLFFRTVFRSSYYLVPYVSDSNDPKKTMVLSDHPSRHQCVSHRTRGMRNPCMSVKRTSTNVRTPAGSRWPCARRIPKRFGLGRSLVLFDLIERNYKLVIQNVFFFPYVGVLCAGIVMFLVDV
jgi:hypothetical protein